METNKLIRYAAYGDAFLYTFAAGIAMYMRWNTALGIIGAMACITIAVTFYLKARQVQAEKEMKEEYSRSQPQDDDGPGGCGSQGCEGCSCRDEEV